MCVGEEICVCESGRNVELEERFNFGIIEPAKLYCSAQPDNEFLAYLKEQYDIKTVAVLRTKVKTEEKKFCDDNDIQVIHFPIRLWENWPEPKEVQNFLELLIKSENHPMLIHCYEGKDRTGAVIALYRLKYKNWLPGETLKEMEQRGVVSAWILLFQRY